MLARTMLAVMDHNENHSRPREQDKTAAGEKKMQCSPVINPF